MFGVDLRRVRRYATLMAVVLWGVWLADMSTSGPVDRAGKIKGTDFIQFYVGGSLVREGQLQDLYDSRLINARAHALIGGMEHVVYLPMQSPQTALAFAPLTALPYVQAFALWVSITLVLYALSCWMTWRYCTALAPYRYESAACAVAFPGLFSTVLHGQTSVLALMAVAAAFVALRRARPFAAGLAIGCLAFKPHWLFVIGAIFLVAREWRVAAGAATAAAVQIGATLVAVGPSAMLAYTKVLQSVQQNADLLEPHPGESLRSAFTLFIPSQTAAFVMYAVAAVAIVAWASHVWRCHERFEARASAIVLATLLVSPHAFSYDLILLAPVFLLIANWLASAPPHPLLRVASWTLAALFVAPVLAVLPAPVRLLFSAGAMTALLVCLRPMAASRGTPVSATDRSSLRPASTPLSEATIA
jgi:hypothetical protein